MEKLKKLAVIIIAFGILSFCVYFVYQERFQIASRIRQIRHHGLMAFAGHSIPVAANWYVQDEQLDHALLLRLDSDLDQTAPTSLHPRMAISLMDEPPIADIDKWVALVNSSFRLRGTEPAERSMVTADGERFSCVGGNMPSPPVRNVPTMVAWHCRSNGNLEILVSGTEPDMNQTWEILSRIQRTNRK